jgi:hypothetical protein
MEVEAAQRLKYRLLTINGKPAQTAPLVLSQCSTEEGWRINFVADHCSA